MVSGNAPRVLAKAAGNSPRFTLRIDPFGNNPDIPSTYLLEPNFPNPFNAATTIRFGLPEQRKAVVEIYDITGRRIVTLGNRTYNAGYHEVTWNATGVASGIYFCTVRTPKKTMTQKMILIK